MPASNDELKPAWKKVFSKNMLIIFILGFASGLPYLLAAGATLKLWLAQERVDIKVIGFFSWVTLAYSLKFLWSPFLDRYFINKVGRRKTWILFSQIGLVAGIFMMASESPTANLVSLAGWAVFVAFMSATQDIAIDAYRREFLSNEELGLGSAMGVYGYRVAMLVSGGVFVSFVAEAGGSLENHITWSQLYYIMAAFMAFCALVTLFIPEPKIESTPRTLMEAVIDPFKEFFRRPEALLILLFVFSFKFGDQISGSLLGPFYKAMGYQNAEIGLIAKFYGLFSSLAGLFVGGIALLKFDVRKCLWAFGILQILATAAFALITFTGPQIWALSVTVIFEDFSQGMGTAAFAAYLASVTNRKYTATQFALLTSIASLGRGLFSGFGGLLQAEVGWANFFYIGALLGVPGLIILWWIGRNEVAQLPIKK